jgi:hypothetical protein
MGFRNALILLATATLFAGIDLVAADAPPAIHARQSASMQADVYVRGERRDQKVSGKLVSHDETSVTLETASGPRTLEWDALTPSSAFTLKSRLIDKTSSLDWLSLGTWGWERGLEQPARAAFAQARKLDSTVGPQVDEVLATESGSKRPGLTAASDSPSKTPPGPTTAPSTQPAAPGAATPDGGTIMQPGFDAGQKIVQYTTPTPEQIAASLADSRAKADATRKKLGIELVELETAHFLIFTDWDEIEHEFLKDQCEGAYRHVSKQFNQPASGNVFVGKLPIYMFKDPSDFRRFAAEMDKFRAAETLLGYFAARGEMGHMAMWKPGVGTGIGAGGTRQMAERNWGRTLVHEFCHAFIHRYKSNARIPRWLNEGTAELISESVLPSNNYRAHARLAAFQNVDVSGLFDDSNMPSGYYYPVMMTMAEWLAKHDSKKFVALFDEIKAGVDPEDALEKHYNVRYEKFAEAWKTYAKTLR